MIQNCLAPLGLKDRTALSVAKTAILLEAPLVSAVDHLITGNILISVICRIVTTSERG
jgi:hypothetical protein